MTLAEFRKRYPEYSDMSDRELAVRLYRKHYSRMPFGEFARRVGYRPPAPGDVNTPEGRSRHGLGVVAAGSLLVLAGIAAVLVALVRVPSGPSPTPTAARDVVPAFSAATPGEGEAPLEIPLSGNVRPLLAAAPVPVVLPVETVVAALGPPPHEPAVALSLGEAQEPPAAVAIPAEDVSPETAPVARALLEVISDPPVKSAPERRMPDRSPRSILEDEDSSKLSGPPQPVPVGLPSHELSVASGPAEAQESQAAVVVSVPDALPETRPVPASALKLFPVSTLKPVPKRGMPSARGQLLLPDEESLRGAPLGSPGSTVLVTPSRWPDAPRALPAQALQPSPSPPGSVNREPRPADLGVAEASSTATSKATLFPPPGTVGAANAITITSPKDGHILAPAAPPVIVVQGEIQHRDDATVWLVANGRRIAVRARNGRFGKVLPLPEPVLRLWAELPRQDGDGPPYRSQALTVRMPSLSSSAGLLLMDWPRGVVGSRVEVSATWRGSPDRPDSPVERVLLNAVGASAKGGLPEVFYIRNLKPGVYTFLLRTRGVWAGRVRPTLYLPEAGHLRARNLRPVSLMGTGRVILARVLLPQGVLWEQDGWFTGQSRSTDAVTKFRLPEGIRWTERRRDLR
ncbi:MAG: hypothetical protein ACE5FK_02425 [Candidatus Methylomirabilia bacterium]